MDYSAPSTFEQTRVHHGYATARGHLVDATIANVVDLPPIRCWYGKLEPGGFIIPHVDKGPWVERWHYPIQPAGYVWTEAEGIMAAPSEPFPIQHWLPHAVWNPDDHPRIHLIVEYDQPIDHPVSDLVLYPILEEMRPLVEAA